MTYASQESCFGRYRGILGLTRPGGRGPRRRQSLQVASVAVGGGSGGGIRVLVGAPGISRRPSVEATLTPDAVRADLSRRARARYDTMTTGDSLALPRSCYNAREVRTSQAECRGFESRLPLQRSLGVAGPAWRCRQRRGGKECRSR